MEELYPEYKEQSLYEKFFSRSPMVPIGVAGLTIIVGHGIYKFRSRTVRPSLFLINYRLAAQGTFVGCIALAMGYKVFEKRVLKKTQGEQSQQEPDS